uniref:WAT1-related protein n=1 Tax=Ananas comosus var. bracteatus TaxID=296719 RepID=A0A6V7P4M4_ANACO|nr:unnamed protein product [Ananas comosus var. bracteatus]
MGGHSCFEEYKPGVAMVAVQCIYAAMSLSAKAAFTEGMTPWCIRIHHFYSITFNQFIRQYERGICFVFVTSLIGGTLNQFLYYQGLHLASSSVATAMVNLTPAVTFVMAASVGLEKVNLRSLRSMAKVIGTIICVGGAISMVFFKGPKLLNADYHKLITLLHSVTDKWIAGALFLIGSSFCWSLWLILQVPICKSYLDPLSMSAWMCLLSTFQSGILTFFLLPDMSAWRITSLIELFACIFAGIFGSCVTYCLQTWCVSKRGPLYSAMFNPLCTVITTVSAFFVLHEELHIGSLIGAIAVVGGLYVVLWGKAEDLNKIKPIPSDGRTKIAIIVDARHVSGESDVREPLIAEKAQVES